MQEAKRRKVQLEELNEIVNGIRSLIASREDARRKDAKVFLVTHIKYNVFYTVTYLSFVYAFITEKYDVSLYFILAAVVVGAVYEM